MRFTTLTLVGVLAVNASPADRLALAEKRGRSVSRSPDGTVEYGRCTRPLDGPASCVGGAGVGPSVDVPLGGLVEKTITTKPDGSWEEETKVTRADGSWNTSTQYGFRKQGRSLDGLPTPVVTAGSRRISLIIPTPRCETGEQECTGSCVGDDYCTAYEGGFLDSSEVTAWRSLKDDCPGPLACAHAPDAMRLFKVCIDGRERDVLHGPWGEPTLPGPTMHLGAGEVRVSPTEMVDEHGNRPDLTKMRVFLPEGRDWTFGGEAKEKDWHTNKVVFVWNLEKGTSFAIRQGQRISLVEDTLGPEC